MFQAEMALTYCRGSARCAEDVFGWSRQLPKRSVGPDEGAEALAADTRQPDSGHCRHTRRRDARAFRLLPSLLADGRRARGTTGVRQCGSPASRARVAPDDGRRALVLRQAVPVAALLSSLHWPSAIRSRRKTWPMCVNAQILSGSGQTMRPSAWRPPPPSLPSACSDGPATAPSVPGHFFAFTCRFLAGK